MRDDSGVMSLQIMIFMVLMLMVGGIAVDVMRFEAKRVALQQTMDRATLAAASMENTLVPRDVVDSYLATSGIDATLKSFTVTAAANGRIVRARATAHSDNYFMSMMDVPYLEADNQSRAQQSVSNVEISMVLDISGSMQNTPSRIKNLKLAAKKFVDDVLIPDEFNRISISVVPYNGQVNIGPTLFSKYNVTDVSGMPNSYCLDLPTETYQRTWISRILPYQQTPHVDNWSSSSTSNSYSNIDPPVVSLMWCQPTVANFVSVFQNDREDLKDQIEGLVAVGATSMDIGLKWGTAFLDPEFRPILTGMLPSTSPFVGRPGNFGDPEVMKVVIIMTDGEHFKQEKHGEAYHAGPSPIWKANSVNQLSIFHDVKVDYSSSSKICNSRPFYVPHLNAWHSRPWNGSTPSSSTCYSPTATYTGATKLTWQGVWALAKSDWVAWQLYARALGGDSSSKRTSEFNTWTANFATYTDVGVMETRFNQLCTLAKQQGIIIYGIAFEAPSAGRTSIQNCASQPSQTFFFNAQGSSIGTAFEMIAANLSQLRLTQ